MSNARTAPPEQRGIGLDSIRRALVDLMDRCHGDDCPECPILDAIESPPEEAVPRPSRRTGRPGFMA